MAEPGLSFADLLRRLRAAARLTQEELAEAAGISPRSVSDLERGINWSGAGGDGSAAAAPRTRPRDIGSFTGREADLGRLLETLADATDGGGAVAIHAIDGMAGIGKTTFAVHAAHEFAGSFPDGQFFLPLLAHAPGQRPVDPADALASLLLTVGVAPQNIPARPGGPRRPVA